MIETILLYYLQSETDIPVYFERPATVPNQYIILEKVAENGDRFVRISTFSVYVYAESLYKACLKCAEIAEIMEDLPSETAVLKVERQGGYNATIPETKEYRYQVNFDIYHY